MEVINYCTGCDNDFYNRDNPLGVKKCWSLDRAKVVTKWRIRWWTSMDKASNFTKCTTLNCHTESGKYAFLDKLPEHLKGETNALSKE